MNYFNYYNSIKNNVNNASFLKKIKKGSRGIIVGSFFNKIFKDIKSDLIFLDNLKDQKYLEYEIGISDIIKNSEDIKKAGFKFAEKNKFKLDQKVDFILFNNFFSNFPIEREIMSMLPNVKEGGFVSGFILNERKRFIEEIRNVAKNIYSTLDIESGNTWSINIPVKSKLINTKDSGKIRYFFDQGQLSYEEKISGLSEIDTGGNGDKNFLTVTAFLSEDNYYDGDPTNSFVPTEPEFSSGIFGQEFKNSLRFFLFSGYKIFNPEDVPVGGYVGIDNIYDISDSGKPISITGEYNRRAALASVYGEQPYFKMADVYYKDMDALSNVVYDSESETYMVNETHTKKNKNYVIGYGGSAKLVPLIHEKEDLENSHIDLLLNHPLSDYSSRFTNKNTNIPYLVSNGKELDYYDLKCLRDGSSRANNISGYKNSGEGYVSSLDKYYYNKNKKTDLNRWIAVSSGGFYSEDIPETRVFVLRRDGILSLSGSDDYYNINAKNYVADSYPVFVGAGGIGSEFINQYLTIDDIKCDRVSNTIHVCDYEVYVDKKIKLKKVKEKVFSIGGLIPINIQCIKIEKSSIDKKDAYKNVWSNSAAQDNLFDGYYLEEEALKYSADCPSATSDYVYLDSLNSNSSFNDQSLVENLNIRVFSENENKRKTVNGITSGLVCNNLTSDKIYLTEDLEDGEQVYISGVFSVKNHRRINIQNFIPHFDDNRSYKFRNNYGSCFDESAIYKNYMISTPIPATKVGEDPATYCHNNFPYAPNIAFGDYDSFGAFSPLSYYGVSSAYYDYSNIIKDNKNHHSSSSFEYIMKSLYINSLNSFYKVWRLSTLNTSIHDMVKRLFKQDYLDPRNNSSPTFLKPLFFDLDSEGIKLILCNEKEILSSILILSKELIRDQEWYEENVKNVTPLVATGEEVSVYKIPSMFGVGLDFSLYNNDYFLMDLNEESFRIPDCKKTAYSSRFVSLIRKCSKYDINDVENKTGIGVKLLDFEKFKYTEVYNSGEYEGYTLNLIHERDNIKIKCNDITNSVFSEYEFEYASDISHSSQETKIETVDVNSKSGINETIKIHTNINSLPLTSESGFESYSVKNAPPGKYKCSISNPPDCEDPSLDFFVSYNSSVGGKSANNYSFQEFSYNESSGQMVNIKDLKNYYKYNDIGENGGIYDISLKNNIVHSSDNLYNNIRYEYADANMHNLYRGSELKLGDDDVEFVHFGGDITFVYGYKKSFAGGEELRKISTGVFDIRIESTETFDTPVRLKTSLDKSYKKIRNEILLGGDFGQKTRIYLENSYRAGYYALDKDSLKNKELKRRGFYVNNPIEHMSIYRVSQNYNHNIKCRTFNKNKSIIVMSRDIYNDKITYQISLNGTNGSFGVYGNTASDLRKFVSSKINSSITDKPEDNFFMEEFTDFEELESSPEYQDSIYFETSYKKLIDFGYGGILNSEESEFTFYFASNYVIESVNNFDIGLGYGPSSYYKIDVEPNTIANTDFNLGIKHIKANSENIKFANKISEINEKLERFVRADQIYNSGNLGSKGTIINSVDGAIENAEESDTEVYYDKIIQKERYGQNS